MDAATEKIAYIGHVYIDGRPVSAKTLSAAGGGAIALRIGGVTFANGGTTLQFGIQDVATGAGPAARPDGTFDVSRTLTGGVDAISASAWNILSLTGGSGSKSIAHGDLIAVVFDLTARAGVDSLIMQGLLATASPFGASQSQAGVRPLATFFTAGAWAAAGSSVIRLPNVLIIFDDGTLAMIDGGGWFADAQTETLNSGTSEHGILFRVPWDCETDALWAVLNSLAGATSDFSLSLYGDPLGTPVSLASISLLAEQLNTLNNGIVCTLASPVALSRNTDYAIVVRATGAGNVVLAGITLGDESYRVLTQGGSTLAHVTRANGSSDAFVAGSPAVLFHNMGVRLSAFHDGADGGGGGDVVVTQVDRGGGGRGGRGHLPWWWTQGYHLPTPTEDEARHRRQLEEIKAELETERLLAAQARGAARQAEQSRDEAQANERVALRKAAAARAAEDEETNKLFAEAHQMLRRARRGW